MVLKAKGLGYPDDQLRQELTALWFNKNLPAIESILRQKLKDAGFDGNMMVSEDSFNAGVKTMQEKLATARNVGDCIAARDAGLEAIKLAQVIS